MTDSMGEATADSTRVPPATRVASLGGHALLYALGNILSKAVAFVMLPVYTRYLSPADYGVAALIEMTLDVVTIAAGAQLAQGVFRFYHKAETEVERREVISTTLASLAVSFGLMGSVVFLGADPLAELVFGTPEHAGLVRLAALNLCAQGAIVVPLAFARVQERSGLVVGATIVKLLVAVGLNLLLIVKARMGVQAIFVSTLVSNLVIGCWLSAWTVRRVGLTFRPHVLRALLRYGVPLMAVQGATFLMTFSDRYFLQAWADETAVGLYNLAYQFGFLLLMVGFVPLDMIWGARRFQVAKTVDPGPALATMFRLINLSVVTVGLGIALLVGDVLHVMSTAPFHPAAALVPVILVAYLLHGWAMLHDVGVLVRERTELLMIANWVAAAVAIIAFAVLIPRFVAFGAAIAAILAFGVRWSLTYHFSQRIWPIRYEWTPIWWTLGAAALVWTLATLVSIGSPPLALLADIGFLGVYFVLIWNLPILRVEERVRFLRALRARLSGRPADAIVRD